MARYVDPLFAIRERSPEATPLSVGAAGRPLRAHEKGERGSDASPVVPRPAILARGRDRIRIGEPFQPTGDLDARLRLRQNYEIAQLGEGHEVSAEQLADMMLQLQHRGCHNINLVTPGHVVAQILEALVIATARGLRVPLVYNTSGYDSPEALALLDGVIHIYLPDMKYGDYQPYFKAAQYPPLDRRLRVGEFQAAVAAARRSGLTLVDGPDSDAGVLPSTLFEAAAS